MEPDDPSRTTTLATDAPPGNVTIYTSESCVASQTLAKYLTGANVAYIEKVVEKDPSLVRDLFAHGLPVTVVEYRGAKKLILGYQPDRILDALGRGPKAR